MAIIYNPPDPKYGDRKVTFEGLVLCEREHNYYDDSDGYSHVYDPEAGKVEKHGTWTTRACSFTEGYTDAYEDDNPYHDEMVQWHIDDLTRLWLLFQSWQYDDDLQKAERPTTGDRVRVVKGRKVPKGVEGELFWMKDDEYSYNRYTGKCERRRIGIRDDDGEAHWTYDNNVIIISDNERLPDPADYIGETEYREELAGKTLAELHSMWDIVSTIMGHPRQRLG